MRFVKAFGLYMVCLFVYSMLSVAVSTVFYIVTGSEFEIVSYLIAGTMSFFAVTFVSRRFNAEESVPILGVFMVAISALSIILNEQISGSLAGDIVLAIQGVAFLFYGYKQD